MIADTYNSPVELPFNEGVLKVKRLTVAQLYVDIQNKIIEESIGNIGKLAKQIEDKDERCSFQIKALKTIPSGLEMESKVAEVNITFIGGVELLYAASKEFNDYTLDQLKYIVSQEENSTDVRNIMCYIRSEDKVVEDEDEEEGTSKKTKKTKLKKKQKRLTGDIK